MRINFLLCLTAFQTRNQRESPRLELRMSPDIPHAYKLAVVAAVLALARWYLRNHTMTTLNLLYMISIEQDTVRHTLAQLADREDMEKTGAVSASNLSRRCQRDILSNVRRNERRSCMRSRPCGRERNHGIHTKARTA